MRYLTCAISRSYESLVRMRDNVSRLAWSTVRPHCPAFRAASRYSSENSVWLIYHHEIAIAFYTLLNICTCVCVSLWRGLRTHRDIRVYFLRSWQFYQAYRTLINLFFIVTTTECRCHICMIKPDYEAGADEIEHSRLYTDDDKHSVRSNQSVYSRVYALCRRVVANRDLVNRCISWEKHVFTGNVNPDR